LSFVITYSPVDRRYDLRPYIESTSLPTYTVLGLLLRSVVSRLPVLRLKASMLGTVCTYPTKR
jgi:hypothetical protein